MKSFFAAALAFLILGFAAGASRAETPPRGVQTTVMTGTLGPYRIGMTLTVEDAVRVRSGHYFYASRLADIPLTAQMAGVAAGAAVVLQEPGGGVFRLRPANARPGAPAPASFYTATGLDGTWTQGGRRLPVRLQFRTAFDGGPPKPWYGDVTTEPDAAFEARVRRFLQAVLQGDHATAAAGVSYPLRVNGAGPPLVIRDRAGLLRRWDAVFTPALLARLRQAVPHEMFVRNGLAMLGDGEAWFDARGAASINRP